MAVHAIQKRRQIDQLVTGIDEMEVQKLLLTRHGLSKAAVSRPAMMKCKTGTPEFILLGFALPSFRLGKWGRNEFRASSRLCSEPSNYFRKYFTIASTKPGMSCFGASKAGLRPFFLSVSLVTGPMLPATQSSGQSMPRLKK